MTGFQIDQNRGRVPAWLDTLPATRETVPMTDENFFDRLESLDPRDEDAEHEMQLGSVIEILTHLFVEKDVERAELMIRSASQEPWFGECVMGMLIGNINNLAKIVDCDPADIVGEIGLRAAIVSIGHDPDHPSYGGPR